MAAYRLVDEWLVPASPEWVYGLLSCPREYPGWWGDAFLEGEGDPGPAAPGKRARLPTRGRLPYRLRWEPTCVEAVAPVRLVSRIEGDFVGEGVWTISPAEEARAECSRGRSRCARGLVRRLTPVLRPLFVWNHGWAMARRLAGVTALAARAQP